MEELEEMAAAIGERLKARGETVAVAESSSGGLISAALLGVPGASKYFLGGAVVYTGKARMQLMDLPREAVAGMRSSCARMPARALGQPVFSRFDLPTAGVRLPAPRLAVT